MTTERLAHPFHPLRLRFYAAAALITTAVFVVTTVGVGTGLLEPTYRLDVVANLLLSVPILLAPLVALWDAPGEVRTPLERSSELVLVFLPLSASSQLSYELLFALGHPFDVWTGDGDPGWTWLWWQYAQADTRYTSADPYMFAFEVTAAVAAVMMLAGWLRLVRPETSVKGRISALWLSFAGVAMILANTITFVVSEARVGFENVEQGLVYGLGFKFLVMNCAFAVLPVVVMRAIVRQNNHLQRQLEKDEVTA